MNFSKRPLAVAVIIAAWPMLAQAAPIEVLSFEGDVNDVDGYPGVAGNGWATPWANDSDNYDAEIRSDNPFAFAGAGAHYLNFTGTSDNAQSVHRTYESVPGLDIAQPHQISFLYRQHTDNGFARIYDLDGGGNLGGDAAWIVMAEGTDFIVFDGDFGTGFDDRQTIPGGEDFIATGNEYLVTIGIRPGEGRYDVHIEDLTAGASIDYLDAQFRNQDTGVSGTINFNDGNSSLTDFDIDMLTVIPEPSTLAFLGLGMGAVLLRRRGRSR